MSKPMLHSIADGLTCRWCGADRHAIEDGLVAGTCQPADFAVRAITEALEAGLAEERNTCRRLQENAVNRELLERELAAIRANIEQLKRASA